MYRRREKDFLRYNIFILYGHIGPFLGYESRAMNFIIYAERVDFITIHIFFFYGHVSE